MKRRNFLGAPLALAALGLAADRGIAPGAAAALADAPSFAVLRLAGSGGEDEAIGAWQNSWPQASATLARVRIVVHGLVRGAAAGWGAIDVESLFLGTGNAINSALLYTAADASRSCGSGAIGFHAEAPHFGGFAIASRTDGKRGSRSVVTLCDAQSGCFAPGLFAIVRLPVGARIDASRFDYSGDENRPLLLHDGSQPADDYLLVRVSAA